MRKNLKWMAALGALALSISATALGDVSEHNRRYINPVFERAVLKEDIEFDRVFNSTTGEQEVLKLRVFEPEGDTAAERPLLLLTPGGGFVQTGDDWMNDVAEIIARAGYVVALNDYRLSESIETPPLYFEALFKAVADQKSALRFLAEDALADNRFRLDLDNVFIGGHSAGAIISMHSVYLEDSDALFEVMREPVATYAGTAPLPEAVSVRGVINLAGLLSDLGILDAGEPPLLSLHGDRDGIVPITTGEGIFGAIPLDQYADIIGLDSQFYALEGALHNDTADPRLCRACVPLIKRFMFNRLHRADPTTQAEEPAQ